MSSIVSMGLRIAARRLLENATLADGAVYDSAIAPIDHMIEEGGTAPFIVISSEDETVTTQGRDVLSGSRSVDLVIEVAIAAKLEGEGKPDEEGAAPPEIVIPATDAGLEISLTLLTRQVMHRLFETRGDWGDLFKVLIISVKKIVNRRGVGNKDGARFAARQIILTLEVLDDPPFGVDPKGQNAAWGEMIRLLEADHELATLVPLIRATVEGGPIPPWDQERSMTGLSDVAAKHLNFAAAAGPDEGAALLETVTFDDPPSEDAENGDTV